MTDCLVRCGLFSSIPSLSSLDSKTILPPRLPSHNNQKDLQTLPRGKKQSLSPLRTSFLKNNPSLFSPILLLITYNSKYIYSKNIISCVGLLNINLFLPNNALHNLTLLFLPYYLCF